MNPLTKFFEHWNAYRQEMQGEDVDIQAVHGRYATAFDACISDMLMLLDKRRILPPSSFNARLLEALEKCTTMREDVLERVEAAIHGDELAEYRFHDICSAKNIKHDAPPVVMSNKTARDCVIKLQSAYKQVFALDNGVDIESPASLQAIQQSVEKLCINCGIESPALFIARFAEADES